MAYPDGYPEQYKDSIFAWHGDEPGDPGSQMFVLTRAGDHLKVYVFQYLGSHAGSGDLYIPVDRGRVGDTHYNPDAEGSFLPADMSWSNETPRLSQPVRRWLDAHDCYLADHEDLLRLLADCHNFDLADQAL